MAEIIVNTVTLSSVPLTVKMQFPYHPSSAGSDWCVLHGNATLLEGSGLYAEVAVQMSQSVREALPSLDEAGALAVTLNAIRKTVDSLDIEFLKSSKRQPVQLSSRVFSVISKEFTYHKVDDEHLIDFLRNKCYWMAKTGAEKAWITDPVEQLYLGVSRDRLLAAAQRLATQGHLKLEGEYAVATPALMAQSGEIEGHTQDALAYLASKHQFERETQKA
ncbi:MAG: hypothetical protein HYX26_04405 [Acidobacteriales bacterium]|nr:hypothetical protein [Terriglobales bacterium]